MPFSPQPKPRPIMLERDDLRADEIAFDRAESQKVKVRSKGRCEVIEDHRCHARAFEVHHHLGGWKLRGRGDSALAKHKTHCCTKHHRLITGHVVLHIEGNRYRRAR